MPTHDDFLRAILASPEDGPRLVYADWLEEYGDQAGRDRAEFIRAQTETGCADVPALQARADQLCRQHEAAWLGEPLATLVDEGKVDAVYRRGFVEFVSLKAAVFIAHAVDLGGQHPLRQVRLIDWPAPTPRQELTHAARGASRPPARRWVWEGFPLSPGSVEWALGVTRAALSAFHEMFRCEVQLRRYEDPGEAWAALSSLCVRFAQSRAGLLVERGRCPGCDGVGRLLEAFGPRTPRVCEFCGGTGYVKPASPG